MALGMERMQNCLHETLALQAYVYLHFCKWISFALDNMTVCGLFSDTNFHQKSESLLLVIKQWNNLKNKLLQDIDELN